MGAIKVSEDLRPISDLKSHAAEIVRQTTESGRPVVLTKHGRGVAVVLSVEDYERLQESMERLEIQRAIAEGERDVALGNLIPQEEVFKEVEAWISELGGE